MSCSRFVVVLSIGIACLGLGSSSQAQHPCESAQFLGAIEFNNASLNQVIDGIPCGFGCYCDIYPDGACSIDMADGWAFAKLEILWNTKPDGSRPSLEQCNQARQSIEACVFYPPLEDCPDPLSSEDCDPYEEVTCNGLESFRIADGVVTDPKFGATPRAVGRQDVRRSHPAWSEPCRAFALLPPGADAMEPADLFLAVGAHVPLEVLAEGSLVEPALNQGRLGPVLLGVVSGSPLWGDESGFVETDLAFLEAADICINPRGALLGSPLWEIPHAKNFPVLVDCDSPVANSELWISAEFDPAFAGGWSRSGLLAQDNLVKLRRQAARTGHKLVCVTVERANQRRFERSRLRRIHLEEE